MAFYAGLDDATKADLATIMKNPEGSLSVKYLGVPLIYLLDSLLLIVMFLRTRFLAGIKDGLINL